MTPRTFFRIVAVAEAITWAFLLIAMFFKYVTQTTEALIPLAGGIHGFMFLVFLVGTVFVWINQRWTARTGVLGLVAAVVPLATVPFDRWLERHGMLDGGWRLAPRGETPQGFFERVQAWVLRNPVVAILVAVTSVSVVFAALLIIGPPVPSS